MQVKGSDGCFIGAIGGTTNELVPSAMMPAMYTQQDSGDWVPLCDCDEEQEA